MIFYSTYHWRYICQIDKLVEESFTNLHQTHRIEVDTPLDKQLVFPLSQW